MTSSEHEAGAAPLRLTEQEALVNVRTVLELCAAGELRCSATTRKPSAATVHTVARHLARGDFYPGEAIAAFAWPLLVQAGGLARLAGSKLELTAKGRDAVRRPPEDTIRLLWTRWLGHAVIDEFSRIEQIKGQRSRNVLSAAKQRRTVVAEGLAACEPGQWIGVDELFADMRRHGLNPTVARSEMALWKLYLVDPQYGSLGYLGYHDWSVVEGRYTLAVLFEYAGTLGVIDLELVDPAGARDDYRDNWGADELPALSRYDGLQAIRLTPLGCYALGLTDTYRPAPAESEVAPTQATSDAVSVLSNGDIVTSGEVTTADQLLLTAYAERTGDRVWAVSVPSLLAAVGAGRDLDEFTAFLQRHSERELPSTLAAIVDDVRRRSGQLVDRGLAWIVECADPALATLIVRDRGMRSLCTLIGDRHLMVSPGKERRFRSVLQRLGYVVPGRTPGR